MCDFEELYSWVKNLPIIDWHNHLDMSMLAEDKPLGSLYEVWVKSDPYKHRAMRICGEPEELITGTGTTGILPVGERATGTTGILPVGERATGTTGILPVERESSTQRAGRPLSQCNGQDARCPSEEAEKWAAWMRTLPKLVGNPLFAWAKMELEWLGLDASSYLHGKGENVLLAGWTPSKMLRAFNVEYLSPCITGTTGVPPVAHWGNGHLARCTLGQRASCPLKSAPLGQRASRPLKSAPLGQRASRPLQYQWTAAEVKDFPSAQSEVSSHFSHTLAAGDFHRRNLPHVGQQSSLVFVTFRLADSLPQSALDELEERKREWMLDHPEPWNDEVRQKWETQLFDKIEKWLDAGHGSCMLADPCLRKIVEDALEYFNATGTTGVPPVGESSTGTTGILPVELGQRASRPLRTAFPPNGQDARCPSRRGRYRLHRYIVMPNHVHVLLELFNGQDLPAILHSWKSYTAKKLNEITGSTGKVWKEEYFDRLIRNAKHYENTLAYIRKNGEAAKALAEINGRDARCPSSTGETPVVPDQRAGRPLSQCSTGKMPVVPVQRARCPLSQYSTGETPVVPVFNGQDARCPSIVPSLRMNVGDEISEETLERFDAAGCRIVDVSVDDATQLTTYNSQLTTVAAYAAAHGWTMLLHLGALRETSARLRAVVGPAGGFAGMRAPVDPAAVAAFLNELETGTTGVSPVGECTTGTTGVPPVGRRNSFSFNGQDARCPSSTGETPVVPVFNGQDARCPSELSRTILLSLNPEAHAQLAVLAGSFVEEGVPGKVQLGPAWWWCDHEEGIRDVLEKNAAYGVLSTFIGMTTDSRSLLSFVRHDYFRRILCKWVAEKVASGAFPDDEALLRPMLENICYRNAKEMVLATKNTKSTKDE